MSDRIKLAEAMGWTLAAHPRDKKFQCWIDPLHGNGTRAEHELPDPFTDANDDYAVLEWIREQHFVSFAEYYLCMVSEERTDYQIGDYARAALKALKDQT